MGGDKCLVTNDSPQGVNAGCRGDSSDAQHMWIGDMVMIGQFEAKVAFRKLMCKLRE